jgi:homeobox protein cut-like
LFLNADGLGVLLGIDLANLIPKLDASASEIVAHQRDSLVQRKDLAQKTKDFRKLDDAGKLAEFRGLLKGRMSPQTMKDGQLC